jgi:hypothetical protein
MVGFHSRFAPRAIHSFAAFLLAVFGTLTSCAGLNATRDRGATTEPRIVATRWKPVDQDADGLYDWLQLDVTEGESSTSARRTVTSN